MKKIRYYSVLKDMPLYFSQLGDLYSKPSVSYRLINSISTAIGVECGLIAKKLETDEPISSEDMIDFAKNYDMVSRESSRILCDATNRVFNVVGAFPRTVDISAEYSVNGFNCRLTSSIGLHTLNLKIGKKYANRPKVPCANKIENGVVRRFKRHGIRRHEQRQVVRALYASVGDRIVFDKPSSYPLRFYNFDMITAEVLDEVVEDHRTFLTTLAERYVPKVTAKTRAEGTALQIYNSAKSLYARAAQYSDFLTRAARHCLISEGIGDFLQLEGTMESDPIPDNLINLIGGVPDVAPGRVFGIRLGDSDVRIWFGGVPYYNVGSYHTLDFTHPNVQDLREYIVAPPISRILSSAF